MTRLLSFTLAALAGYVVAQSWRHHRSAVREFTTGGVTYGGCAEVYDDG